MLISIIFIVCSVIILLSALLYIFQPNFVYFPMRDLIATPGNIGLEYDEVRITTEDSVTITGWYIPHPASRKTLLFLHGNAGNISHRLDSLQIFYQLGLSVLIIDYRGYGESEGSPTEHGTYLDAEAAWKYLINERKLSPEQIIVFGRSLGGAIATWLARQYQPAGLIIESTFTSIVDMGKKYYPYLPVNLIARIRYPSLENIDKIYCPKLFIHSIDDEIIPYAMSQQFFDKANTPKQLLAIKGGHNDGFIISGEYYVKGLQEFLISISGN